MNQVITYLSFFLWLIFFLNILLKKYYKIHINESFIKWYKKNKKNIIYKPAFLLTILYIIFACFRNSLVNKIMFISIITYLFGISMGEKDKELNKIKLNNKSYITSIILIFLIILPFEFYFIYHKLMITYIWLLIYIVFYKLIFSFIKYLDYYFNK